MPNSTEHAGRFNGEATAWQRSGGVPPAHSFAIVLRGLHERKERGRRIQQATAREAFRQAIGVTDYSGTEPVLEWSGTSELAALDVDYHQRSLSLRPGEVQLRAIAEHVLPRPMSWWRTHGRGLRLIYHAQEGFAANELAAAAGLSVRSLDPQAVMEIKSQTRHPRYSRPEYPDAGPVVELESVLDLSSLHRLLGQSVDDDLVNEWLADQGMSRGQSYSHDRCPCDPQTQSHGMPVHVGDEGIFCHRCDAAGLTLGGTRSGFFSFAQLIGGGVSSMLRSAVRGFCHWQHAQHVVRHAAGLDGRHAELAFRALLNSPLKNS